MSTHLFLGISIDIFDRFAPAGAHLAEDPFRYRHIVGWSAAAPITKGYMFW